MAICHLNDEGEFMPLEVSYNSLKGHLEHGDRLANEDGSCTACSGGVPINYNGGVLYVYKNDLPGTYTQSEGITACAQLDCGQWYLPK